jgi:hypothetical protein
LAKAAQLEKKEKRAFLNKVSSINPPDIRKKTASRAAQEVARATQQQQDPEEPAQRRIRVGDPAPPLPPLHPLQQLQQAASASAPQMQPVSHVGLASRDILCLRELEDQENINNTQHKSKPAYRKVNNPALHPQMQNDAAAFCAMCSLLTSFGKTLTTCELENTTDTTQLDCTNTFVLIQYNDLIDSSPQGGANRVHKPIKASRPVMRVAAIGPQKAASVIVQYGRMTSPSFTGLRPDIDLQYIVKEDGKAYSETMESYVSNLKNARALPARQTLSSIDVQAAMSSGKTYYFAMLYAYAHIHATNFVVYRILCRALMN